LARRAVGPLPIGPDGPLVEYRVPEPQLETILEQRALTAGIDNDACTHFLLGAVVLLNAYADGLVLLEKHLQDARGLVDVDALLSGILQHHHVELAANDLPGLRAFMRLVVPKVKRRRH